MSENSKYIWVGVIGAAFVAGLFFVPDVIHAYKTKKALEAFGEVIQSTSKGIQQNVITPLIPEIYTEWVTIKPRDREACKKESNGVLDDTYRRCRNGRQELIRVSNGRRSVISERPIPTH